MSMRGQHHGGGRKLTGEEKKLVIDTICMVGVPFLGLALLILALEIFT
jgi:hypothetical protein